MLKKLPLITLITFGGCAAVPLHSPTPAAVYQFEFQNGQTATIKLTTPQPELQAAFKSWVAQGLYNQTPVYRQVPYQFLLVGKPRLTGQIYQSGPSLTSATNPTAQSQGNVGLVVHADGTLGPELMLHYGIRALSCCQNLQVVTIGTITRGNRQLSTVKRGDNLLTTTPQQ